MEKLKNKQMAINISVGLAVGLLVVFFVKQIVYAPQSYDKLMMQTASKINESCPIMVDQETRLDNVVVLSDNVLQYNYTLVKWIKDSIDIKAFEENMQPIILNNLKRNPDFKIYRDNKTTMAYNYKDMNGVFITRISIKADKYLDNK